MIYLLDITTIITLISDITCDKDIDIRFGSIDEWKNKNMQIYKQILDEKNNPIKPILNELFENNELVITQSAYDKIVEMITALASTLEKNNLDNLLKKIKVIKDDPSQRFNEFGGRVWTILNKNIFGTADKLNITVVSGNINVINFINNNDIDIKFIAHRSRCFVGKKYEK